ncbi:MAG: NAD(+)/NADH kinase [Candidatus Thermoplasmatota archaeon]|nr:NAD(+)/NADH kinase [Candidatus Thermoplasmatota archaeon]MEC9174226.1 NAD(+)/NADH kinase [Candidatus Thermoplasmatota archaeon]
MERRIGIIVNPDAGLGGRLALKGSDGMAEIARAKGAEDRAGPRMYEAFEHLSSIIELSLVPWDNVHWLLPKGRMGDSWIPEKMKINGKWTNISDTPNATTAEDTINVVNSMIEQNVEIILYAGGDGTTRDIIGALENIDSASTPILGIPAGVKMHSGSFAASPRAAAEAFAAWFSGDLLIAQTEVMDLDETMYREGEWVVKMYAEAMSPGSPRWMQGSKQRIERVSEVEILESLGDHLRETIEDDPELLVIWGSGGTLRTLGESIGFTITVLGIDVTLGNENIGTDLDENQLINTINEHKDRFKDNARILTLLSPMGGQGFLIGRGNLQLSPTVIRSIGIENILAIVTPAKLATLNTLRIDTGDINLDQKFQEKKYMKALQGYRTTRLIRISAE